MFKKKLFSVLMFNKPHIDQLFLFYEIYFYHSEIPVAYFFDFPA